jgi:hypothetical protein
VKAPAITCATLRSRSFAPAMPLGAVLVVGCGSTAVPALRVSLVARDIAHKPGRLVATVGEPVANSHAERTRN